MKDNKFLGICIVIAAIILAAAVLLAPRVNRYQMHESDPPGVRWVLDTARGSLEKAP